VDTPNAPLFYHTSTTLQLAKNTITRTQDLAFWIGLWDCRRHSRRLRRLQQAAQRVQSRLQRTIWSWLLPDNDRAGRSRRVLSGRTLDGERSVLPVPRLRSANRAGSIDIQRKRAVHGRQRLATPGSHHRFLVSIDYR
jgi:hypothetical protein